MYNIEPTVNPGRFRKQKALVSGRVMAVRAYYDRLYQERAYEAQREAHIEATRLRLIFGIKTKLGFKIHENEQFPPVEPTDPFIIREMTSEPLTAALCYIDPAFSTEDFDRYLGQLSCSDLQDWLQERYCIIEVMVSKEPWYMVRHLFPRRYPNTDDQTYWFDPKQVDQSALSWHDWKLITVPDVLEKALESVRNTPGVVWSGTSSEHFTPRLTLWARFKKWAVCKTPE